MQAYERILAAVDFSDRSRVALGFAARLACRFRAELHVLHAQDPLLSAAAEASGMNLARESEDELRALVAATWPAERCRLHFDVMVGRPAATIVDAAERERADLIVLAAHGMSGAEHALLGSTAEGVLKRSKVSVLVVPDGWTPAAPDAFDLTGEGPLIVGLDFRLPAIEAAAESAMIARTLRTGLLLVHVVPTLRVLARWREHAEAALERRVREATEQMAQVAATVNSGVPTRTLVERGRVAPCLAEIIGAHPHAIAAVGRSVQANGYAPPGKTAYRLLTQTRVPVLMHVAK